ncbi:hypothetical protein D3H55_09395 [Bacillus salacetis]|uniref:Uncharacterized protein n=2 Tax=Bacillus salacetis TaxID=2315464 RepID=A0A3A1QZT1_9BACI|nr:hypothetical protein D3H55_09395 [Bacillus salacetis]
MFWSSIISLVMSAAAYGMNRRRMNNTSSVPYGGLMKNRNMSTLQAAMIEFADEIAPDSKFR